ncbi:hypothetical protein SNEBB_003214 [Seison nebaliae]|nr:hypothetical protein SNEBB_003214 [Seison nebaliae]
MSLEFVQFRGLIRRNFTIIRRHFTFLLTCIIIPIIFCLIVIGSESLKEDSLPSIGTILRESPEFTQSIHSEENKFYQHYFSRKIPFKKPNSKHEILIFEEKKNSSEKFQEILNDNQIRFSFVNNSSEIETKLALNWKTIIFGVKFKNTISIHFQYNNKKSSKSFSDITEIDEGIQEFRDFIISGNNDRSCIYAYGLSNDDHECYVKLRNDKGIYYSFLLLLKSMGIEEFDQFNWSFQLHYTNETIESFKDEKTSSISQINSISLILLPLLVSGIITPILMVMIEEKETQVRHVMIIIGMKIYIWWIAWFSLIILVSIIQSIFFIILTIIFDIFSDGSNRFELAIVIFLYACSFTTFSFVFYLFFDRPKTYMNFLTISDMILNFLFVIPMVMIGVDVHVPKVMSILFCFNPSFPFQIYLTKLDNENEKYSEFLQNELDNRQDIGNLLTSTEIIIYQFVITILYLIITIISDHFINKKYAADDLENGNVLMEVKNLKKIYHKKRLIPKKYYQSDDLVAVNDLSFKIERGELLALIGHNGAGKTSLIKCLIGMEKWNDGSISMNEKNSIGICPQENTIIKQLTCYENILAFSSINGQYQCDKINSVLSQLGLLSMRNKKSGGLSGGQKRKLSLAMAVISQPQILILDEPTTGMDPQSRHNVWKFLKNYKMYGLDDGLNGTLAPCIILSTHYMDEADIVGDNKLMMAHGQLRCYGTSLDLKMEFGSGKYLTITKKTGKTSKENNLIINQILQTKDIKLEEETNELLKFFISSKLPSITFLETIKKVQEMQDLKRIYRFIINSITLEHLFLKLNKEENESVESLNGTISNQSVELQEMDRIHRDSDNIIRNDGNDDGINPYNYLVNKSSIKSDNILIWYNIIFVEFMKTLTNFKYSISRILIPLLMTSLFSFVIKQLENYVEKKEEELKPLELVLSSITSKNLDGRKKFDFNSISLFTNESSFCPSFVQQRPFSSLPNDFQYSYTNSNSTINLISSSNYFHLMEFFYFTIISCWKNKIDNIIELISVKDHSIYLNFFGTSSTTSSAFSSMLIPMTFTGLIYSFAIDVAEDRINGTKKQMLLTKATTKVLWISLATAAIIQLLIMFICVIIIIFIAEIHMLTSIQSVIILFFFFLVCCPMTLFLYYLLSFFGKRMDEVTSIMSIAIIPSNVAYLLVTFVKNRNKKLTIHYILSAILPPYNMYGIYHFLQLIYDENDGNVSFSEYLAFDNGIFWSFICSFIWLIISILLLNRVEYVFNETDHNQFKDENKKLVHEISSKSEEVEDEEIIVTEQLELENNPSIRFLVYHLYKRYDNFFEFVKTISKFFNSISCYNCLMKLSKKNIHSNKKNALTDVTIAFRSKEIFGLLGPNGAGKSSLMNIMVNSTIPDYAVMKWFHKKKKENIIGYCPQTNPLYSMFTTEQHLAIYDSINNHQMLKWKCWKNNRIKFLLDYFNLTPYAGTLSKNLSGGNKRKLILAISILRNPDLLLLDEPSSGMDPFSRRNLWKIIKKTITTNSDRATILTSHSMDEIDELCCRIAILINGELKSIGLKEYLKNKYNSGYVLHLKRNIEKIDRNEMLKLITDIFNKKKKHTTDLTISVVEIEHFNDYQKIRIDKQLINENAIDISNSIDLYDVFDGLENLKNEDLCFEYEFTQMSLEQLFLDLVKFSDSSPIIDKQIY